MVDYIYSLEYYTILWLRNKEKQNKLWMLKTKGKNIP